MSEITPSRWYRHPASGPLYLTPQQYRHIVAMTGSEGERVSRDNSSDEPEEFDLDEYLKARERDRQAAKDAAEAAKRAVRKIRRDEKRGKK